MARKRVSVMMGAVVAATTTAFAATYTWTDGAGDHLFSTPGNWDGGAAPTAATAADTLAFTTGGFATNDIAGLTVGDIAVTLAAGDELTLGGAQKIGGSGTLTLGGDGTGTLVFDVTGGLDEQPIVINGGIFKVGASLTGSALGSSADTAPIRVNAGGTLDVNYTCAGDIDYERCQVTHDKLIYIAGTGAEGAGGAIVNTGENGSKWPPQLGDVILTADATIGPKRTDVGTLVNGSTEYGARATHASITGDYVLTFTDTAPGSTMYHGVRNFTISVKSITVTNGADLLIGENATISLSDDILRLVNGGKLTCSSQSSSLPFPSPITVEGSNNRIRCTNGSGYFNGPITIPADAALTFSQGNLYFYGKVTGDPLVSYSDTSYCNAYFKGGLDGIATFKGASGKASGRPIFDTANSCFSGAFLTTGEATIDGNSGVIVRKDGNVFAGSQATAAGITVNKQNNFGVFGDETEVVLITNSTISVSGNFTAGRLSPRSAGNKATMRLGEGTTVTAGNVYTGNNAWPNHGAIEILSGAVVNVTNSICVGFHDGNAVPPKGSTNEWLTVDGGTLNATAGIVIGCGYRGPQSRIYLKSGTMNVNGVCLQGYRTVKNTATFTQGSVRFGGTNTYQFVMTGGTLNLGSRGFKQYGKEENSEANVILSGGTLNATADFTLPFFIPTLFGTWRDGFSDSFTLNTAGHEVELCTALTGASDVTLTGAGTIAGTNAMQGVLGGKWTVNGGMKADLRGAASFLGGLDVGANAAVTLDVGAGRSAAFFSRDGSAPLTAASASTNILARFNQVDGGTVASTISRDLWLWNVSGSSGTGIPGYTGGTGETLLSKGEFYVEEAEAGTWTFSGIYGDNVYIQIDDQSATSTSISTYAHLQVALSAGWHRFVVICVHNSGDFGPKNRAGLAIGFAKTAVSGDAAAGYVPFSPRNLKMRPSAPSGGAATVRWSTFKKKAWKVPSEPDLASSNHYEDLLWDTVSLTNSLKLLDRYGTNDARMNTNTANRFDGWFLVPFDQAGTWKFQFQYDFRMRIYIDGVYIGVWGEDKVHTADWPISAGWHRYEIRVFDTTGNSGPKDGSAVSYAVKREGESSFGEYIKFNEDNLTLALTPDGYLQGEIALASGAAVTNVSDEAAIVWGDISAAGATGAVMSGKFACVSNTVDFGTVAADTADLSTVLKFHNAATNLFTGVGKIAVNFAAKPTRGTILIGPAGGLEALSHAELARRFRVTVDGVPASEVKCIVLPRVSEGKLYLNNVSGTQLLFR